MAIGWRVWTIKKIRSRVDFGKKSCSTWTKKRVFVETFMCVCVCVCVWFTKFYFPWYLSLPTRNIPTKLVNLKAWDWGKSNTDSLDQLGNYPLPKIEPVAWVNWLLYWRLSRKIYYALLWKLEYEVLCDNKVKQPCKFVYEVRLVG